MDDPFPESRKPAWAAALVVVAVVLFCALAWRMGWLEQATAAVSAPAQRAATTAGPARPASSPQAAPPAAASPVPAASGAAVAASAAH